MKLPIVIRKVYYLLFLLVAGCGQNPLPYFGHPSLVDGKTEYPRIAAFNLLDQDSTIISLDKLGPKVHVADFIFLSCPTICPRMNVQMKSVYDQVKDMEDVVLLSYTIDPKRDGVPQLRDYARSLSVNSKKWHFLTGNQDSILALATNSYYAAAYPDSTSPGGFTHSGGILLVDKAHHVRGVYDGTDPKATQRLIIDIRKLVQEK